MKELGEFEIFDIFRIGNEKLALAGTLKSGDPISNDRDITQKKAVISFEYNGTPIERTIIKLDGVFVRGGLDLVIHAGDHAALIIASGAESEDWTRAVVAPGTLIGKIRTTD